MKTLKTWGSTLAMAVAALSFTSCNDYYREGDWDPMVWKADMPVQTTDGAYNVAADGETLSFSCRNYTRPWFSGAEEDGEQRHPADGDNTDYRTLQGEHFEATMQAGKLTVTFKPNADPTERHISITVTAGDIFYTFKFKQFGHVETELEKERRLQAEAALQGVWFLDEQEVLAKNLIGDGLTRYDRSQEGYVYDFHASHFTIRRFDNAAGTNKLADNGTYTIRHDENTGDTTLLLYTYTTAAERPQLLRQYSIYQLDGSSLELREQSAQHEVVYRLSPWAAIK